VALTQRLEKQIIFAKEKKKKFILKIQIIEFKIELN